ncbi:MAG: ATP-binding protein [Candidatus Aminicenantes bacterium]|jgi:anti-sigma regulatory factor (Ser/Thr protein kinase)
MEDLSLHILDIVENSVAAEADRIEIRITEDTEKDFLSIEIIDNGTGMDEETVKKALDPFYTTKKVRRFGFGLSFLSEAAKAANGDFSIQSQKGQGTRVKAEFQYSHIDRQPMGDMGQTIMTLIIGNPDIDLVYIHKKNGHEYSLDTGKIKAQLGDVPINSPEVLKILREDLKKIK